MGWFYPRALTFGGSERSSSAQGSYCKTYSIEETTRQLPLTTLEMADRQLRTSKKKGNSSEAKRDISPYEPENNREVSPMIALHYAKHLNV